MTQYRDDTMARRKESPRESGQKYYPNEKQAKKNRSYSAKAAARERKMRGTQWRHGRKSKSQVRGRKKRS